MKVLARPLPILAVAALGVTLAACSTTPDMTPASLADTASSAPMPIAGYDWFYDAQDDHAGLAFGLAESDDVWLDLSCQRNGGRIAMSRPVPAGHALEIRLESGGDTETYRASAEPSELHEGVFLTSEAPSDDPVFVRFRRVGWLAVLDGDQRHMMVPHSGSASSVERFFAFCG